MTHEYSASDLHHDFKQRLFPIKMGSMEGNARISIVDGFAKS